MARMQWIGTRRGIVATSAVLGDDARRNLLLAWPEKLPVVVSLDTNYVMPFCRYADPQIWMVFYRHPHAYTRTTRLQHTLVPRMLNASFHTQFWHDEHTHNT